jgi:hypothetical protein
VDATVLRSRLGVVACASLHRVSLLLLCDGAALRGIVSVVDCSCACVSVRCVHACVTAALQWWSGAALRGCCRRRRRSLAVRATHQCDTCPVRCLLHCCSVRADSDCSTVVEVLCVPPGVVALDAAARGRGRVCTAALPSCITSLVTSTLSVQCSGVCNCGAVWVSLTCYSLIAVGDSVWSPVLLCCCVAVCGTALHWTVAVAVSGSSRTVAVAMRRC